MGGGEVDWEMRGGKYVSYKKKKEADETAGNKEWGSRAGRKAKRQEGSRWRRVARSGTVRKACCEVGCR
ncbi:hypothetical protein GOP47_0017274 [Adiantum capillus-veneris]|uniref:Uncharacterized protein n=1 Tax=Adiantum capillus-veneris TaxID=13818 RepID=A0A9D4ZBL0_ADICA|nr:hypothetical protein GOP47_0017274 [Adiantum capillus-veneris]